MRLNLVEKYGNSYFFKQYSQDGTYRSHIWAPNPNRTMVKIILFMTFWLVWPGHNKNWPKYRRNKPFFAKYTFYYHHCWDLGVGGHGWGVGKGWREGGGIKGSYYMKKPCYKRSGRKYEMSDKWEDFVLDLRRLWRGRKQINPRTRISNNTT